MDTQYDDDTFYAEIRRQILLLTSEDNEESLERKSSNSISVANGGSIRSVYNSASSPHASHFCSWETDSSCSPPDWLVNLWKNGKGTGVFIPQVVTCRKKNRQGTMISKRQIYKPVVNKD